MLQRACGELMALKNVVVINDEAHHCYREKAQTDEQDQLKGEDKDEAKKNNEAARLWISGIEALKRKVGVRATYDLSATPFFLRGSGYAEGTLFPWTISDFSLMDAIECGIVNSPVRSSGDEIQDNPLTAREGKSIHHQRRSACAVAAAAAPLSWLERSARSKA
jgi:type III restriction enzyme